MSSKWGLLLPRDSMLWELVALKYISKYLQSLVETKESERVEEIKLDDGV